MKMQNRQGKTPEEAFDRQLLSEGYVLLLWIAMFMPVTIEVFVGLMPEQVCVGVAVVMASIITVFILGPLLWESDANNRLTRRIRRVAYFPIRTKYFLISKVKIVGRYGGIFWLASLAAQVIGIPFFGAGNILLYQGTLLAAGVVNIVIYLFLGTVGAWLGE